ncbi:MAG: thymidine phosphorylase [Anaerolineales bacterium]|jgi:pyrimidine-nucleoside phosphorylase
MRTVDIIEKKRDGETLTHEEIQFFVKGFTSGEIPDYQTSAWAMAVLFQGMTPKETADLTMAMAHSGDVIDLSDVVELALDKHSTGGVGDKTTLVVEPIVNACGVPVGKMSGRGLSFTGGTLDKMESIPGYNASLTIEEFKHQLKTVGLVLAGQTGDLAPADGKLYALRDVTGTVPSIPLIASSVMSKKLASGAQAIVLDVKVGLGAFMPDVEQAHDLAKRMVEIGVHADRKVVALLSDMNQPLGRAVGNALEVKEAIATLRGEGPEDFRDHCYEVAAHMLILAGKAKDAEEGRRLAARAVEDGKAIERFTALVGAQGGDTTVIEHPEQFSQAEYIQEIPSPITGSIHQIHAREVGLTVMQLGGGRERKGDPIDHAVGVVLHHRVGDKVERGDTLFTLHANDQDKAAQAVQRLLAATKISQKPADPLPLFYGSVWPEG